MYREHYDTWQSESAYIARNECSYCGAFKCDGTCTLPEIEAELDHWQGVQELAESMSAAARLPINEAFAAVCPDGRSMGIDSYETLRKNIRELESTVASLKEKREKKNEV